MNRKLISIKLASAIKMAHEYIKIAEESKSPMPLLTKRAELNQDLYDQLLSMGYLDDSMPEVFRGLNAQEPMDDEGMHLGAGAHAMLSDLYTHPDYNEIETNKLASCYSEIIKIGKANHLIQKMKKSKNKKHVKVACEMDFINKDYFVSCLKDMLTKTAEYFIKNANNSIATPAFLGAAGAGLGAGAGGLAKLLGSDSVGEHPIRNSAIAGSALGALLIIGIMLSIILWIYCQFHSALPPFPRLE